MLHFNVILSHPRDIDTCFRSTALTKISTFLTANPPASCDKNLTSQKYTYFHSSKGAVCRSQLISNASSVTFVRDLWDVAQLVERRTGTPPTQVRFPSAARDFFSQSQLSVQTLLRCLYTPLCNHIHSHLCAH